MASSKVGKLLAKALSNSSRDEAVTAFGMAFSYAKREGIALSSIHKITVTEEPAGCSPDREAELVDKYNRVLRRAKDLLEDNERLERLNRARQEFMDAQEIVIETLEADVDELKAEISRLEALKAPDEYLISTLRTRITILEREQDETKDLRIAIRGVNRDLDTKTRDAARLTRELDVERHKSQLAIVDLHKQQELTEDIAKKANEMHRWHEEQHARDVSRIAELERALSEAQRGGLLKAIFG